MRGPYSQRPLPEQVYAPGLSMRPETAPPLAPWKPSAWRELADWLYGIDLYNHGYFWESHEAWEALWQSTPKTQEPGLLLRGLIQAAACLLKLREGNARGVKLLGPRSLETLAKLESHKLMGLEIFSWREELRIFLDEPELRSYPRIRLRF